MSDQDNSQNPSPTPEAGPQPQGGLGILAQYVKDLSFENPNALQMLGAQTQEQPQMNANLDVKVQKLSETDYEVTLALEATAKRGEMVMFAAEIDYAAIFRLQSIPPEHVEPVLMIECPRMLFPYARRILSDMTQEGGYPPLFLNPVDFAALYKAKQQGAGTNGGGMPVGTA